MPHRSMEEIMADYNKKRRETQVLVNEQDRKYEARLMEENVVVEGDEGKRHLEPGNEARHIKPGTPEKA